MDGALLQVVLFTKIPCARLVKPILSTAILSNRSIRDCSSAAPPLARTCAGSCRRRRVAAGRSTGRAVRSGRAAPSRSRRTGRTRCWWGPTAGRSRPGTPGSCRTPSADPSPLRAAPPQAICRGRGLRLWASSGARRVIGSHARRWGSLGDPEGTGREAPSLPAPRAPPASASSQRALFRVESWHFRQI